MWDNFGRLLLVLGGILVVSGALIMLGARLFGLGRLPGDIFIQRGNFTFYIPIVTCIILSILLTIIINLIRR
jgi:hypothetical protein